MIWKHDSYYKVTGTPLSMWLSFSVLEDYLVHILHLYAQHKKNMNFDTQLHCTTHCAWLCGDCLHMQLV